MEDHRLLNIVKNLNYLLSTLEQISAQKLLEFVPDSEYNDIYVKFDIGKNTNIVVSLFNSNTKSIVKKIYTLPEILRKCTNFFAVMEFMNNDMINLYNKSKECIFDETTLIRLD